MKNLLAVCAIIVSLFGTVQSEFVASAAHEHSSTNEYGAKYTYEHVHIDSVNSYFIELDYCDDLYYLKLQNSIDEKKISSAFILNSIFRPPIINT